MKKVVVSRKKTLDSGWKTELCYCNTDLCNGEFIEMSTMSLLLLRLLAHVIKTHCWSARQ